MPPHMRVSPRILSCLAAVPIALALGGCTETLDIENAERTIGEDYAGKVQGAEVRSVDCPDDVSADIGTTATCTMTLANDVRLEVALNVTGEDGRVSWETVSGTLPGPLVERQVQDALERSVGKRPDAVSCPARVAMKVGSKTRCTLTAGDKAYGLTVTMTDNTGAFDIDVDEQPLT